MSDNTINAALRRLGYSSEEQTCHGFRSTASTLLNEQGFPADVIELQLAHTERNKVRAAYNKAQRLAERRDMMQQWADYLWCLKEGVVIDWGQRQSAFVAPASGRRSTLGGNETGETHRVVFGSQ